MANFAIFTAWESYQTAVSDGDVGFDRVRRDVKRLGKEIVASDEWLVARNGYASVQVLTQDLKPRPSERVGYAVASSDCDSAAGRCRRGAGRSRRRWRRNRASRAYPLPRRARCGRQCTFARCLGPEAAR